MRILVTDLTDMAASMCVAGWCERDQRMVRPLPDGRNWSRDLVRRLDLEPGAILRIRVRPTATVGDYPHTTEDVIIDADDIVVDDLRGRWWLGENAPPTAATLGQAFGGRLLDVRRFRGAVQGPRVAEGARTRSLWALAVDRSQLSFFEDDFRGSRKLKVHLDDGDDRYDISVSSAHLKSVYDAHGVAGVDEIFPARGRLHVRVGLARASQKTPGQCVVMINGVFG